MDRDGKYKSPKASDPAPAEDAAPAPPERKKIIIKPRSVPLGEPADAASAPSSYKSIFGDAKPRDEKAVEKKTEPEPAPLEELKVTPPTPLEELKVAPPAPLDELKVAPPAPPTTDANDEKREADKTSSKERRPTKPTWSQTRAARVDARGEGVEEGRTGRAEAVRGERRDKDGSRNVRAGRAERVNKEKGVKVDGGKGRPQKEAQPTSEKSRPAKNSKADVVEEKEKNARPVNTLVSLRHYIVSVGERERHVANDVLNICYS